jgi:hypothetical protein
MIYDFGKEILRCAQNDKRMAIRPRSGERGIIFSKRQIRVCLVQSRCGFADIVDGFDFGGLAQFEDTFNGDLAETRHT